jgi:hypothetical protein
MSLYQRRGGALQHDGVMLIDMIFPCDIQYRLTHITTHHSMQAAFDFTTSEYYTNDHVPHLRDTVDLRCKGIFIDYLCQLRAYLEANWRHAGGATRPRQHDHPVRPIHQSSSAPSVCEVNQGVKMVEAEIVTNILQIMNIIVRHRRMQEWGPSRENEMPLMTHLLSMSYPTVSTLIQVCADADPQMTRGFGLMYKFMPHLPYWDITRTALLTQPPVVYHVKTANESGRTARSDTVSGRSVYDRSNYNLLSDIYYCAYVRDGDHEKLIRDVFLGEMCTECDRADPLIDAEHGGLRSEPFRRTDISKYAIAGLIAVGMLMVWAVYLSQGWARISI